ncbi:MAG TPA: alpha/beta hydrolase [Puia sp.]|jgi:poly(3-hydroxybutyrate) depolymerase|nr:alpha/beta hydrolase [Puia sp.]
MLNYILSGGIVFFLALPVRSQMKPAIRYKDDVFPAISVQKDLSYVANLSPGSKGRSHLFDWYEPKQDSAPLRPLIIWMHGGGFKFGSKGMEAMRLWSTAFARRGYVCAAINYQLGRKDLRFQFEELVKGCYEAVQDARQAIDFFKNNAARLRIDTNRIILAGNSAGGMMALQIAYGNDAGMLHLIGSADSAQASHLIDPGDIAAVVNFWGGIFQPVWLQDARVPIVSVHGKKDPIMPYDHKGFPLYGSGAIHRVADSLHIPNSLKTYDGYSHELQRQFNPLIHSRATKKRWVEAGQFAADFLYEELFDGSRKE